jgi:acyl-CoA thioesterase-1
VLPNTLKPDLNQDDGMHPNAKGTLIVSDTLTRSIINYLKN